MFCYRHEEASYVDPVGGNVGVKSLKVCPVGRRMALLVVDKVVRGISYRIPSGYLDTFQIITITYDDFPIY